MSDGCILCGYNPPGATWRTYAEGQFCEDVAGCRRRALSVLTRVKRERDDLGSTVLELERRLSWYERVDEPEGDPPEPAEGHGIDATEERL